MSSGNYLIGVDGGGSKTAVALTDTDLSLLHLDAFPRSNPGDIGTEASLSLVREACLSVCRSRGIRPEDVSAVFAGIAGGSAGNYARSLRDLLSESFPGAVCGVSDDGTNVLFSAFSGGDGVSVICGTGSSCFVKRGTSVFRIGGFGQFDLKGNGFEIGRAAFAHVFRVLDGRDPAGWLSDEINRRFEGGAYRNIIDINGYGKNEFAAFAPLVFEAAERHGDACAESILRTQIAHIAELIQSAGRFFREPEYAVSLSGGLTRNPLFLTVLRPMVPEDVSLFVNDREPWTGAAAKAKALLSGDPPLVLPSFLSMGETAPESPNGTDL
ncbi:MAG: hypothetical protein ILO68_04530 [Clostridia bacterium]|nr:hypothetical protein [Clostridia bacterium]